MAVLGKTGSGKTTAIKGAVEGLLAHQRRVCIVDPTSAWWGLRSSADGKKPGFPILVLGGDHGDLPLPALGGAAVARLVAEQNVNLVADTSLLTVGERTRWFIDFGGALYRLNRAPLHLVLDEAHMFAPQGKVPDPDTGKMLHAATTLASAGRSRGIRLTMITQRPAKLHKDALTCADTLIAMRVLAPQDRIAVEDWIKGCGDIQVGKEVLNSLAGLKRGEGWVWYPEGNFLKRMQFPAIKTFDSSATPTDGHAVEPKNMADIDLTEISAAMADAVKQAEANDPKRLRARIVELEREARTQPPPVDPEVARQEYERGLIEGRNQVLAIGPVLPILLEASIKLRGLHDALDNQVPLAVAPVSETLRRYQYMKPAPRTVTSVVIDGVSAPQQRILDELAALEGLGIRQPNKTQLALWCEVSPTSGGYFNNLGGLRSAGLIGYPSGGEVSLTDAGRSAAQAREPLTVGQMQDALCARVGNAKAAILRALIHKYPGDFSKDDLAKRIDVSPTSGGYFNNLGSLRSLGVIDYPAPGRVAALPVLFLEN